MYKIHIFIKYCIKLTNNNNILVNLNKRNVFISRITIPVININKFSTQIFKKNVTIDHAIS